MTPPRRNPCELEIDLLCEGIRIDADLAARLYAPAASGHPVSAAARRIARTRAGLGSGLELVIPGSIKPIWTNIPVEEDFAFESPYVIRDLPDVPSVGRLTGGRICEVQDERNRERYEVELPPEPAWYGRRTTAGTEMARVGVLQGTYLGIYVSNSCTYWYRKEAQNCRFCTTGANVGVNEVATKSVADVVEVARAAKEESGVTFVHFNTGYQNGRGLDQIAPYVKAVKEEVGALIGVQAVATPDLWKYDWLADLGTDHFSFCYEFHNPDYFARLLPGKEATVGQQAFFDAMEYTAGKLGKGAVSGEIIAGVEPLEDTFAAIDYITSVGAFPTVCIFRPVIGSDMEATPSPDYGDMRAVMKRMWEACRDHWIPIGAAPNIEVSLIVNPTDSVYLADGGLRDWVYRRYLGLAGFAAQPLFASRMRPRELATVPVTAEPERYGAPPRMPHEPAPPTAKPA